MQVVKFQKSSTVVLGLLQMTFLLVFNPSVYCLKMVEMALHSHSFHYMPFDFSLQIQQWLGCSSLPTVKAQN